MPRKSAGVLMYRLRKGKPEFFLVHPGGPFWAKKDKAVWSIPKGEFDDDETALEAAKREFSEETGLDIQGNFTPLTSVKSSSGKIVFAFAVESDADASAISSNMIGIEWPPRSGKKISIPEVDKAGWFDYDTAKEKLLPYQVPLIDELYQAIKQAP